MRYFKDCLIDGWLLKTQAFCKIQLININNGFKNITTYNGLNEKKIDVSSIYIKKLPPFKTKPFII